MESMFSPPCSCFTKRQGKVTSFLFGGGLLCQVLWELSPYGGSVGVCSLWSFLWFITRYLRYLMDIWWIYFMGFLISFADMLRFFYDCIDCS